MKRFSTAARALAVLLIGGVVISANVFLFHPAQASGLSTNTVVLSSLDPSVVGQSVTFAIAVAPAASSFTYPTGSVTLSIDGANGGSASLQKGYAQITVSSLAAGSHAVVATYSGDGMYGASVSSALTQLVNASFDKPMPTGIDVTKPPYNLKGDGVTDNTAAFRAMVTSFPLMPTVASPARNSIFRQAPT
jgi:hypothetical protein